MPKRLITLLACIAFVLLAGYAVLRGSYPVMIVDGATVSDRVFQKKYGGALAYYESALQTYTGALQEFGANERRELKRAALEGLAEEALIHEELLRREPVELASIVENKTAEALKNPDFATAARALYGLSPEDAKRYLLVPQAEREILEGRLFLEKRELEEWLHASKRDASVTVLLPGFSWNNGGIVAE